MLTVAVVAISLTIIAVVFHVSCLRRLRARLIHCRKWPLLGPALILIAAIAAHLIEIGVYGVVFGLLAMSGNYGSIGEEVPVGSMNYFFVSAETYTALGYSDNTPTGPLRLFAAFEALTGLILITWSASLGYTAMDTCWNVEESSP